jgi:hypothetical protein
MPLLSALGTPPAAAAEPWLDALATLPGWRAELDAGSRHLIAARTPWLAGRDLDAAMVRFTELLARDGVRNAVGFHTRIRREIAAAAAPIPLETLNRWVYDELFLTPAADPWLGLAAREVYSVLAPVPAAGGD